MELEIEKIKFLNNYIIPHIALTTYKYRAKAAALCKAKNAGASIDQFIILKALSHLNNLTQQELAEILYKDKSNLSRMIDSLASKGLIKCTLDTKDNRAVKRIQITDKGLNLVEKFFPYAIALHDAAFEGISPQEIETVKSVMKKIRSNLDKNIEAEL